MGPIASYLAVLAVSLTAACADNVSQQKEFEIFMSKPYCREYQSSIIVGGKPQETWGQACRRPDGSWEIMK